MTQFQHSSFGATEQQIATMIDEIIWAYRRRDFDELSDLGNRLATQSVIAKALQGDHAEAA